MFKKIIIILIIFTLISLGINYYNSKKTVECWWTMLYPCFSYSKIENNEIEMKKTENTTNYNKNEKIELKFFVKEWLDNFFKEEAD